MMFSLFMHSVAWLFSCVSVNYRCAWELDSDGNGNPMGIPWDWYKNLISRGSGNGNDPHSYGNLIPMDNWKEHLAVLLLLNLSSIACGILCKLSVVGHK